MGTSTNAILFYGYVWKEEAELCEDNEWIDVVLAKRGVKDPYAVIPYVKPSEVDSSAYFEAKRLLEEEIGCDIGFHCSGAYAIPYVFITDSEITAYRGDAVKVASAQLIVSSNPSWAEKLDAFVQELEIDLSEAQGPGWFLVSYWG